jgi:hypothetical protein
MTWQSSKQLCFSAALLSVLISASTAALATSKAISGDSTKQRVELPELATIVGKAVKLRFQLSRGSLYAFWVTSDPNGASNGYVGAGGPDFSGVRDVPSHSR